MAAAEIEGTVRDQIAALAEVAESLGVELVHCKPHGALYHAANKSAEVAAAIGRAVLESSEQLIMVGQAGSSTLALWESMGLTCAAEAFADRAYEPDGSLVSRRKPGAVLHDPQEVAARMLRLAQQGVVTAVDGSTVRIEAESVCVHGDSPGAVEMARQVRLRLEGAGVAIRPFVDPAGASQGA